ncbi:sperm mitochondrial-associated cysteine-rich protein-like [Portunus trituberculatus]|uniref:Uncharacterized protein n=1 Tax=Portunus trituberculatus TaxID=210409 RepID=A0A5B7CVM9_PORTR|nr:sperm mitochondrial-associated cysteine-rich protein-like [Portunus trituberculatus]MPC13175.1 hypothetical protein [Portunus trituberculatus]
MRVFLLCLVFALVGLGASLREKQSGRGAGFEASSKHDTCGQSRTWDPPRETCEPPKMCCPSKPKCDPCKPSPCEPCPPPCPEPCPEPCPQPCKPPCKECVKECKVPCPESPKCCLECSEEEAEQNVVLAAGILSS